MSRPTIPLPESTVLILARSKPSFSDAGLIKTYVDPSVKFIAQKVAATNSKLVTARTHNFAQDVFVLDIPS